MIRQRNGRMIAERHRPFDVVVDGAGKTDDLDPESLVDRPGAPQASIAAKHHLLLIDIGGACWLEDVERRVREVSRADLENSELWRRLP